jgi:hypothetical protein
VPVVDEGLQAGQVAQHDPLVGQFQQTGALHRLDLGVQRLPRHAHHRGEIVLADGQLHRRWVAARRPDTAGEADQQPCQTRRERPHRDLGAPFVQTPPARQDQPQHGLQQLDIGLHRRQEGRPRQPQQGGRQHGACIVDRALAIEQRDESHRLTRRHLRGHESAAVGPDHRDLDLALHDHPQVLDRIAPVEHGLLLVQAAQAGLGEQRVLCQGRAVGEPRDALQRLGSRQVRDRLGHGVRLSAS